MDEHRLASLALRVRKSSRHPDERFPSIQNRFLTLSIQAFREARWIDERAIRSHLQ